MTVVYRFKVTGFKDRQSSRLKPPDMRKAILIETGTNTAPKVIALHKQQDFTLLPLYLEILFNLDTETETWEVRSDHLFNWCRSAFSVGNRYDLDKRLNWLDEHGLMTCHRVVNDQSRGVSLGSQGVGQGGSLTPQSSTLTPLLEPPQTRSGLEANFPLNKQTNKQPIDENNDSCSSNWREDEIEFQKVIKGEISNA